MSRRSEWLALGVLLAAIGLLHGHGLSFGFFFDDSNHLELCAKNGYGDLAGGNRFDWTRSIARAWWVAEETGWAYFRPIPVAIRTACLQCFGLDPLPFHVVHLSLYTAVVMSFYGLLRRLGIGLKPALAGGLLFTLNPTHAVVSPWLANDTTILTALGYIWGIWLMRASADADHRRPLLALGAIACYALALLSRESGLMLGPILVMFDWLGRRTSSRPWKLYALLTLEGVGYLVVRSLMLEAGPLPRSPYFHWPTEGGFASWLSYKVLSDAVCLTLGLPFVPIAQVPWLQARPIATALAVGGGLSVLALFAYPLRRSRVLWGILGGMALAAAPTICVFSAAYNYFLLSAGWAALLAVWAAALGPRRPRLVSAAFAFLACSYLVGSWSTVRQMRASAYADQLVREEVLASEPQNYPPGTKLFFLNLPLFACEVGPAVRLATGRDDLEFFPLTLAPEPFAPRRMAEIHREGDRTLLVRMDGDGWFAGPFGEQVQLGWFGSSRSQLTNGFVKLWPGAGPMPFQVEVVEAGPRGIRALRFTFDKPLEDPCYRFFIGNPTHPAQQWHPSGIPTGRSQDPYTSVLNGRIQRMQMGVDFVDGWLASCP